jgi:hypothetical protein
MAPSRANWASKSDLKSVAAERIRDRWRTLMSLCWAAGKRDFDFEMGPVVKPEQLRTDTEQENDLNKHRNLSSRALIRVLVLALIALSAVVAFAQDDTDLKFRGGIGVVPVTGVAANGTVNLNVVRGVSPGGPWRIAALAAEVESNGHIKVIGRGLLLASGNGIGTNAAQTVHATLFCGPATAATAFDSVGVPLEADGDFTIDGFLSSTFTLPCVNPVLLIRNATGVWFAAGIPSTERKNDRD